MNAHIDSLKKNLKLLKRKWQTLHSDIWNVSASEVTGFKYFFLNLVRVSFLSKRGFSEDQCFLRAMALTYFTLLSLVPFAAMAFGIAKGFGLESKWEALLLQKFGSHETVLNYILTFSKNLLMDTRGGLIAGFGIFFLFWTVIKVFTHIENSFNAIWGIRQSRSFYRKITDYLTLMLICPVLFIAASSATVYAVGYLNDFFSKHSAWHSMNPLIFSIVNMVSFVAIWCLFSFLYLVIPNTRVRFDCAFVGGLIAGTAFAIMQKFYVYFQINMTQFNAIYGSFAALPLFLIWLQLSWILVLLGAEISFSLQNLYQYEFETESSQSNYHAKLTLSMAVLKSLQDNFDKGLPPLDQKTINLSTQSPFRLLTSTLQILQDSNLILKVESKDVNDSCFQISRNLSNMKLLDIITLIENHGVFPVSFKKSPLVTAIESYLNKCRDHCGVNPYNLTLGDLHIPSIGEHSDHTPN